MRKTSISSSRAIPASRSVTAGWGWSTIALIRAGNRAALIDVGGFGIRKPLIQRLGARNLAPADVTDVLLTHAHHDHAVNWSSSAARGS